MKKTLLMYFLSLWKCWNSNYSTSGHKGPSGQLTGHLSGLTLAQIGGKAISHPFVQGQDPRLHLIVCFLVHVKAVTETYRAFFFSFFFKWIGHTLFSQTCMKDKQVWLGHLQIWTGQCLSLLCVHKRRTDTSVPLRAPQLCPQKGQGNTKIHANWHLISTLVSPLFWGFFIPKS